MTMKKIFLILTFYSIFYNVCGQEFLGIKVDGKKDAVIQAFKSKGFKIKPDSDITKDVVTLEGMAGSNYIDIAIVCTPKSKTVWKFSVRLPEKTSWSSLKSEYEQYLDILINKYGEPQKKYNFFSSPYKEGDGYEMTALSVEKCFFSAYWTDNTGVSIKISKFKQVNISYENATNSLLDDKERSDVNKNIF